MQARRSYRPAEVLQRLQDNRTSFAPIIPPICPLYDLSYPVTLVDQFTEILLVLDSVLSNIHP
jgi:hypothetical protein